jgi:UDP-glucose 4-epimerase
MKILVTGGAGFIGSHLCDQLIRQGHTVICLDNFLNGNLTNIRHLLNYKSFKLINGDVRDFDSLEKFMPGVEAVFHLAAQIHVDRSIIEPKLTYDVNVLGTQNVLEAARIYDVEKVIHMSTSEVYGSAQFAPMTEDHPLAAPHPYGASKIAADRMCYAYNQTYHMNITIVRPFNAFGPRQKDTGYGGVMSIFVKRVMSGMPPIIYGDGNQSRDYTYVADVVDALDLILKFPDPITTPINLGTGREIKIIDLANMIIDLSGQSGRIKPAFVESRPGEVQRLLSDNSKVRQLLGWTPQFSLEDGLHRLLGWYKNYKSEEWSKPG